MDHNCLDEVVALNEAADELGLARVTLRAQAGRGILVARNLGTTWITTRKEVERYRREHLGKLGRPGSQHSHWSDIRRAKGAPEIGSPEDLENKRRFRAELEHQG